MLFMNQIFKMISIISIYISALFVGFPLLWKLSKFICFAIVLVTKKSYETNAPRKSSFILSTYICNSKMH